MTWDKASFEPPEGWVELFPAIGALDWGGAPGTALMTVGTVGDEAPRVFKLAEDVS